MGFLNDLVTWIDSVFTTLQQAADETADNINTIFDKLITLQDQISMMIEAAKYYIIISGIVLAVILIIQFVLISKLNATKKELAEIKEILQPADSEETKINVE